MSAVWPTKKLREIADIRVSNVDKKTYPSEKPVKLCNYMDVYSNDYVTGRIDFMEASATQAEIERFGLKSGDVIITKDSETPDDIGIPTVITEEIAGLVCGYHLALIRPDAEELDSIYLAKQLSTSQVTRYFSLHASGSTRYGLPVGAIESLEIPTPPVPEQTKIAEILSTVDRAIEQTEALIAKQQRLKTGLMQDLLTRGIDQHGNLRSEQTHKFKDSQLGRIPVEWEVVSLQSMAHRHKHAFVDGPFGSNLKTIHYREAGVPITLIDWKISVEWRILPASLRISKEHSIRRRDLLFLVTNNPFIPPGHEGFYLRGIQAGFFGDCTIAMHMLIPQLEASVRNVIQQHGGLTSTRESDGTQKEKDINQLLWDEKLGTIFGQDILFDLRGILIEKCGCNMRNELAHGLMPENAFYRLESVYLWWLVIRLCWIGYKCIPEELPEMP